ncbi:MAG: YIP1 family protein [Chlamydiales bacterium]|nr:YIP1 family protein [Chlamydiales bacterium]
MRSENINPWIHIWTRPKKTMRAILESDPKRVIIWLAILGGIFTSFASIGFWRPAYPEIWNVFLVISTIILGGIIGLVHLYVGGWLYRLTGSWLSGRGTFIDVKCAVGWSNYPFILSNIAAIISLLVRPNPWPQFLFGLANIVIAVWGIIIFLNLLGEAHRFSAWKSLLAVIIAFILIFVVVMIIALIIPLLVPLFV